MHEEGYRHRLHVVYAQNVTCNNYFRRKTKEIVKKRRFVPRASSDGRYLLNLACGTRVHPDWNNMDFSPYARLYRYERAVKMAHALGVISDERYQTFRSLEAELICWDLRKGIPCPNDTFDVVYHSHFLEHLELEAARAFLGECHRVIKPGGVLRVVVPDIETVTRRYLEVIRKIDAGIVDATNKEYERAVWRIFGQMVMSEGAGTSEQPAVLRQIERLFRGDARNQGHLHRWMYDRYSLAKLIYNQGFKDVRVFSFDRSYISQYEKINLDEADGKPYHSHSLYMDAIAV